jgi:hypothetical protein
VCGKPTGMKEGDSFERDTCIAALKVIVKHEVDKGRIMYDSIYIFIRYKLQV